MISAREFAGEAERKKLGCQVCAKSAKRAMGPKEATAVEVNALGAGEDETCVRLKSPRIICRTTSRPLFALLLMEKITYDCRNYHRQAEEAA